VQRVPTADDRARLDEMSGLRGELADSLAALEAEVGRLRGVVATATAPVEVAPVAPADLDWDLPPLDPAWTQELDELLAAAAPPAPAPEPLVLEPEPEPAELEPQPQPVPRRRLRPTLPAVLATAGALAVTDAAITVVWEEPVTALYGTWQQSRLDDRLEAIERETSLAAPDPAEAAGRSPREAARARMAAAAARLRERAEPGDPLGRLRIPKLGGSTVVVEGTGDAQLRSGPGRYRETGLPGQPGAVVGIAGHRTSWSAPFRHIDRLKAGDRITVTMPYGRFDYRVTTKRIVRPEDVWVLQDRSTSRVVLTACHPLFSAAKRIVVSAELVRATPRGAARQA
jgi:sortase A